MTMLLRLLNGRRLDLRTTGALYERIGLRPSVAIRSRSDCTLILVELMTEVVAEFHYLLLAVVLPRVLKHDCHINHGL